MLRERRLPPGFGPAHRPKRAEMTGERFGDFTAVKHTWGSYWQLRCDAGHEKLTDGTRLRADRKAGRPGPVCRECRKGVHP
jgi:hypothetical protein